jgi:hypothetical protein
LRCCGRPGRRPKHGARGAGGTLWLWAVPEYSSPDAACGMRNSGTLRVLSSTADIAGTGTRMRGVGLAPQATRTRMCVCPAALVGFAWSERTSRLFMRTAALCSTLHAAVVRLCFLCCPPCSERMTSDVSDMVVASPLGAAGTRACAATGQGVPSKRNQAAPNANARRPKYP